NEKETLPVSIGRPLPNVKVYILDEQLEPVPVGIAGQLYVSGAGVARGYLGNSGLTAETFVANPFGPPGARMYRTGDRVRYRENGELEYLGRVDHQVKVRGFRIQPGQVESTLLRVAEIDRAVVIGYGDGLDK